MEALLPTPIKPRDCNVWIISPAMLLLPQKMDSLRARVMMLAIAGQESRLTYRDQIDRDPKKPVLGPALGLWQFERKGGTRGVMSHASTQQAAKEVCRARGVDWDLQKVWERLAQDDILAACFARLLLWSDAQPLPQIGNEADAWDMYAYRTWNPGSPHRHTWHHHYINAVQAVG